MVLLEEKRVALPGGKPRFIQSGAHPLVVLHQASSNHVVPCENAETVHVIACVCVCVCA